MQKSQYAKNLETKNKVLSRDTRSNQQQYKKLRMTAKKLIRRKKRGFINSKMAEILLNHSQNNLKKFYTDIKFHSSSFQLRLNICRDIKRNILEEEDEIL